VERHALFEEMFDSRRLHIFVSTEPAAPAEPGEVPSSAWLRPAGATGIARGKL
jgi:hypothetical protein